MVSRPTILVLGAGASQPYGYPLGCELKNQIWRTLRSDSDPAYRDEPRERVCQLLRSSGFRSGELAVFSEKLERTPRSTIDEFLECRGEFNRLGKAAITLQLLTHQARRATAKGVQGEAGLWYHLLYQRLGTSLDDISGNKLTVVTFNYDRSLDDFLVNGLINDFDADRTQCERALYDLGPIHLHGVIPSGVTLDTIRAEDLGECADSLHVVGDREVDMDPNFTRARERIVKSEQICFLGFGYDKRNVERLRIYDVWPEGSKGQLYDHPPPPEKSVTGTTYGMNAYQIKRLPSLFDVSTSFREELTQLQTHDFLQRVDLLD